MAKRLTQEEVIDRCNIIFNYKYVYTQSVYVSTRVPMDVICPIHGKFSIPPKRHLRGQGCPFCGAEYARTWRKGDWKHFIERFTEKYGDLYSFPNIENEYENEKSILTMYCKRCGTKYELDGNYLLSNRFEGCTNCKYFYDYNTLSNANKTENSMTFFEGLKDSRVDKVQLICEEHGEYDASVSTILKGKGKCIKCNGHSRLLTQAEAYKRIREKYGDYITPITPYIKSELPMTFKCINGHIFDRDYNTAMCAKLYSPCPICSKIQLSKERTKTLDKFIEDAIKIYGEDKYDFTDTEYFGSSEDVTVKCNECGRYFTIEANSFLQGHGCPYHNCNSSLMEKELANLIKGYDYEVLTNSRSVLDNGKEIDIYVPSLNIAFEFDGLYWHSEINKGNDYHLNKTVECEKKGIKLYHIFEDEWTNKKDIIIGLLNGIFNANQIEVSTNDCQIVKVDFEKSNDFLCLNHIHGGCNGTINYALYKNGEILSLMSFTEHSNGEYELLRFCNKINHKVVNAEETLFNTFVNDCNPSIVTFNADRRWHQDDFVSKINFHLSYKSKPTYYYVVGNERKDKSLFTKEKLIKNYNCPKNMPKQDFIKSKKWYKIYNCGNIIYKWTKDNLEILSILSSIK